MSPISRFFRLIRAEKKDLYYLYGYAIMSGLINLSLPLGTQAIIGLVSSGQSSTSLIVLIGFVLIGLLFVGILQIMQFTLVEYLQQRIFTNAALEFSYRVTHIKMESILRLHAPEMMNRFFDILTIQKGISKLLLDLSAASLQIFFGLLLLSFYHPFFIFLGIFFVIVLALIIRLSGPRGLESSLKESKHKYRVVHILEEIARTLQTLKLIGKTDWPEKKVNDEVNLYLEARTKHFKVVLLQMSSLVSFKFIITGSLLVMGSILLIDRQLNIGQFVAAEIIIIIILNAVDKLMQSLDVVYDVLTAIDKVGMVTDMPLENYKGHDISKSGSSGFVIDIENLSYSFPDSNESVLNNISLKFESGKKYCLSGFNGSGKTTFINVICGLYENYTGSIRYDNYSLRDLNLEDLRLAIGDNLFYEDIFEGSILENISVNRPDVTLSQVYNVVEKTGLLNFVSNCREGINTELIAGAKGLPGSITQKIIMARCLVGPRKLLLINDAGIKLIPAEKRKLILDLLSLNSTIIFISNDVELMKVCDETIVLKQGKVSLKGPYESIKNNAELKTILEQ
jgi:ABC-type bacteriocin/lantibiotic exporter with double-glycine peptidase domain